MTDQMDKGITVTNNSRGDITIKIPRAVLRYAVLYSEEYPEGSRVTHTKTFSDEVVRSLLTEDESGATYVNDIIDMAIDEAIEQGALGVKLGNEDY